MDVPAASTPIVCDMTDAPDTSQERLAEYQRLFAHALIGRERTPDGIRFRFRGQHGVDLARPVARPTARRSWQRHHHPLCWLPLAMGYRLGR